MERKSPVEKTEIPSYQRIKQELLQDIARGNYAPGQVFITQQEACQRFQVSRITAERAINDLVRDGILVRRRGQGTFVAQTPALTAPVPLADAQKVIACIVSVTRSDHKTAIIRGVSDVCQEADCHLLFFDSSEKAENEAANLRRAHKAGVQGIVIYPVDGYHNTDIFVSLLQEGMPLVMVDRYYPHLPTDVVVPDHVAIGYEVTRSLIDQGHRIIATLWQEVASTSTYERLIGYKQALREALLDVDSDLTALRPYSAMQEEERYALLKKWLHLPNPPTALLTVNSYILGLVWTDLLHLGVQVGEKLVFAAMDKDETGVPLTPGSGGIVLPSYEMGREAMRILLNRLQGDRTPARQIMLPVSPLTPASGVPNVSMVEASQG